MAAAVATACASSTPESARGTKLQAATQPARTPDAGSPPLETKPFPEQSVVALIERGTTLAAGMRKLEDGELSGEREIARDLLTRPAKDTCVRILWNSSEASAAKLLDQAGRVLAETSAAKDGKLGERGPVCVRRGETMRVQWTSTSHVVVRFAAWAAP